MSRNSLALVLFFVLIAFIGFSIHGSIREQEAYNQLEAENRELEDAILNVHRQALTMRIAFEIGMPLVAKDRWDEVVYPAIQDALALCVEVSE